MTCIFLGVTTFDLREGSEKEKPKIKSKGKY
jgi:hypothetical protein